MGFVLQGLAPNGTWFLLAIPLMALWGFTGPSVQALMTRQVDVHEQGRLQGAVASLASIAGLFGPYLFTHVFASFLGERATRPEEHPSELQSLLRISSAVFCLQKTKMNRTKRNYQAHKK